MSDSRILLGTGPQQNALAVAVASGSTLTAAAEALLVPDVTVPANYFLTPGQGLRCFLAGRASCAVATPGTLTLRVRLGGLAGVVLCASAALTQNVIVQTDQTWWWETFIVCQTVGVSGTFMAIGRANRGSCAAAVVADIRPDMIPATAPAVATVNTTVQQLLSFTAQPSLTTASITCHSRVVLPF